ncbi:MAG: hypothetical protein RL154_198 [Pseudomonadota bacterium]|jgi:hypothetical protein
MQSVNNTFSTHHDLLDFFNASLSVYTKLLFAIKRFNVCIGKKTQADVIEQFISCMEQAELFSTYTSHIISKNNYPNEAKPSINAFKELTKELEFMLTNSKLNKDSKKKFIDALNGNYIPDI